MKLVFQLVAAMLMTLALAACHVPAGSPSPHEASEIRLYKVPTQGSHQIAGALGVLLAGDGKNDMAVTEPFPGTLMVLAPPGMQDSVKNAITSLGKAASSDAGSGRLELHFWVVDARVGPGVDGPALKPLAATLDRIRASLGPSHFTIATAVSAATSFGESGQISNGSNGQFNFKAMPGQDGAIKLKVAYDVPGGFGAVSTTIATRPGRYVVLAQARKPDAAAPSSGAGQMPDLRLLVVRVDRATSPAH